MERTVYDDLIDIALDNRDFEWVKQLKRQKELENSLWYKGEEEKIIPTYIANIQEYQIAFSNDMLTALPDRISMAYRDNLLYIKPDNNSAIKVIKESSTTFMPMLFFGGSSSCHIDSDIVKNIVNNFGNKIIGRWSFKKIGSIFVGNKEKEAKDPRLYAIGVDWGKLK
jgi:hypothetical protein